MTTLSSVPGSFIEGSDLGEDDADEELCLGDSKMEYNFLTFPLKELLEESLEPNDDVPPCKLLTEPFRWKTWELQMLNNGLFSAAAAASAEEFTVNDRLKTADGLLLMVVVCVFFPIL